MVSRILAAMMLVPMIGLVPMVEAEPITACSSLNIIEPWKRIIENATGISVNPNCGPVDPAAVTDAIGDEIAHALMQMDCDPVQTQEGCYICYNWNENATHNSLPVDFDRNAHKLFLNGYGEGPEPEGLHEFQIGRDVRCL